MATDTEALDESDAPPLPVKGKRGQWQHWLLIGIISVLGLVAGAMIWLDSPSGHRFVIARIEAATPASGLRIRVGGIDGSIYRRAILTDVRLLDPSGQFLSAPTVLLDWWPLSWISNRLDIDALLIPRARLHHVPRFTPSRVQGPLLPDFDIRIMRLQVGQLDVDPPITGTAQKLALMGDADVRSGRAVIDLTARSLTGDDRLVLALDSRPDDNVFDIDLTVNAPKRGVLAALAGLRQDANLQLRGNGTWAAWNGTLVATLDQQSAAGFRLSARSGLYGINGSIEGRAIAGQGLLARITSPQLSVDAQGRFANRLISGRAVLRSAALMLEANGGIDLRGHGYDNLTVDARVLRPDALLRDTAARNLVARLRMDGPFSAARFEYLVSAQELRFGKTRLFGVKAIGAGRTAGADRPVLIPLTLTAQSVDGQGDLVGSILHNFRLTGTLQKQGAIVTSGPLSVRSDKLNGHLVALFDLKSGRYDLALTGDIRGLSIPGLGIVDITSAIKAVPGAKGGFGLTGLVEATMRRLDNSFLRTLGGGLPKLRSHIALQPGGLLLDDLTVHAPLLDLRGSGRRLPDGTVDLTGSGRHKTYGPLRLHLTGHIERPKVDVILAAPLPAARLSDAHVILEPDANGYGFVAQGGSILGPFTGRGRINLPRGADAIIAIEALRVGEVVATGTLRPLTGGLSGTLTLTGPVTGTVALAPVAGVQQIAAKLEARNASFDGPPDIAIRRGSMDATVLLQPDGTTVDATVRARGLQVGSFRISNLAANAQLKGGSGRVRASLSGQRGRLFDLQFDAAVRPDDVRLAMTGALDRKPIRLSAPAHLTAVDGGWQLDPVTLYHAGGSARVSGRFGSSKTQFDAAVNRIPLSLLDLSNSDLGLGGTASGHIDYLLASGGVPTGSAQLQFRGLTRSGVTRTSTPIDVGMNALLQADRLAIRATATSGTTTVGRAQALLTPLGTGSIVSRIQYAPVRAQLRYAGPAEALWRLSRIEILDINGTLSASADVGGTLANPVIRGAIATADASVVSPVTGMRLSAVRTNGRFDGSQLVLTSVSGVTRGGGTVSGSGRIDFSAATGVGMDIAVDAKNAELLNRDDIGATVTGPLTLKSDGNGGVISGNLDVVRSRFVLGRAAAVAQIPELRVIERNGRQQDFDAPVRLKPWQLAIKARARNRLMVSGMGLNSEWRMAMDIGGDVSDPILTGTADLVRGSYDFAGRRFDMSEGQLRFDGSKPVNPTLDITAEGSVTGLTATIRVTGTSANPIINFTSVPSLPEDEVLSRILFGSSITQLSAPEAIQLAAAVASLQGRGGGLDPINAVRKAAGLDRLRILPADTTTGQGTSVAVGKYLTRKTYVELVSDGQGYSATRVEYQVTRWLSLLGSISTIGRQSASVRVSKDY